MHDKPQPFEQDIEWLIQKNKENKLKPPTENSQEAFAEKVAVCSADKSDNRSTEIIRSFVYSLYKWGGLADMPEIIHGE